MGGKGLLQRTAGGKKEGRRHGFQREKIPQNKRGSNPSAGKKKKEKCASQPLMKGRGEITSGGKKLESRTSGG